MQSNRRHEYILLFIEKYLTLLNISITLAILSALLIFFGSLFPEELTPFLERLFENKYWPFALILFEYFRREVEKKSSILYKDRIAKIEAVALSGKELEAGYLLTIINGRDGELSSEMTNNYLDARMKIDNPIK